ncbi:hypothetical protein GNX18_16550 [Microbulbifer sp. SH-1]|uniref:DUF6314 family protein n=1 Tax=Microbulbifer sp. SH-1 TaxID=2681547 RepID=UPI0014077197|nr:DUF6314 family protein [Microbulbifer sp. SH-1]QIL91208.1 hypothetical protein GNX18_16550 [Microbulbifer sp. SH-1]
MTIGLDYKSLAALAQLCERLKKVRAFSFNASNGPGSQTNWRGHGRGEVEVTSFGAHILFAERAKFTDADGHKIDLQNTYRWTRCVDFVRLEHLRREEPVMLFNLVPVTEHGFRHQSPHLCGEDTYTADLILHPDEIELIWQIDGPRKNERLHYHYW